jgi:hypothetical protein
MENILVGTGRAKIIHNKLGGIKVNHEIKSIGIMVILVIAVLAGILPACTSQTHEMDDGMIEDHRNSFIAQKERIIGELMPHGDYRCCLEKPCTYCIEKTPGHGEGATCNCLEDVVTGVHPCGECIGEILEGHGNPYLAEYFANAIAEKTGEEDAIKRIIEEKYGIPVEKQV